jgi:hypothetical protein
LFLPDDWSVVPLVSWLVPLGVFALWASFPAGTPVVSLVPAPLLLPLLVWLP